MKPQIITLMGPTATGKTALALELAKTFPIEIISVDSALVYAGMDIGTAKPSKEEQAKVPHHLIDICQPNKSYSAGRFVRDAKQSISEIFSRGNIPLLVGGTMLYFKALFEGLAAIPDVPSEIRQSLQHACEMRGLTALYEELKTIDPLSAAKIHANDQQRILRALEVFYATDKPLSFWQTQSATDTSMQQASLQIALMPEDRAQLHAMIEQRFERMLAEGFAEEVIKLREQFGLTIDSPSMRSVGYRQVMEYLEGALTFEEMKAQGIYASRQLAKRQMTWLRPWPNAKFVFAHRSDTIEPIKILIENFLFSCTK